MDPHDDHQDDNEPLAIQGRTDTGTGWAVAWPLIALALIGLMLVKACIPTTPATAPAAPPATTQAPR